MDRRSNNLGLLRIIFASMVLLTHAYGLTGHGAPDPLEKMVHVLSFGDLAVAGFFIISGYLVTASYLSSRSVWEYLAKRILRIYPAFLVASFLCVFAVAPLVADHPLRMTAAHAESLFWDAICLNPPGGRIETADPPYSLTDLSLWSIGFEFRCYLLVAILGFCGVFKRRSLILFFAVIVILARTLEVSFDIILPAPGALAGILISPDGAIHTGGYFLAGMAYRLFQGEIKFTAAGFGIAVCAFALSCMAPGFTDAGVAVFFAYAVFWAAFSLELPTLGKINRETDISYGIYIYGWPVGWLLLKYGPQGGPLLMFYASLVATAPIAYLSWVCVERPALNFSKAFKLPAAGSLAASP